MAIELRSWDTTLPRKFAEKVAAELEPNEAILWVGQPGRNLDLPPDAKRKILLFLFVAVVASIVAVSTEGLLRIVLGIVAGLSCLLVVGGLSLPALWRLGVVQRNYFYLLTERRAIICSRSPYTLRVELRAYTPAELSRMVCVDREDGSGDLRFDEDPQKPASMREGFIMIDRVHEVENLVRQTLKVN